jgi:small subunit ribosomal protein S6
MEKYELTVIMPAQASAKKKSSSSLVEKILTTGGAKIIETQDWGEKELAYKIDKNTSGIFSYYVLELEPKTVNGICKKLSQEDAIIRYLLIRRDK